MARKRKSSRWSRRAQLKVRLPEPVRHNLEIAARRAGHSMNVEAVRRLSAPALLDPDAIAAERLLNSLDQRIVTFIEDIILRANAEKLVPEVRKLYELYPEDAEDEQKDEQEDNQGDKS